MRKELTEKVGSFLLPRSGYVNHLDDRTVKTFPYYNIEKSLMTHLVGFINSEIIWGFGNVLKNEYLCSNKIKGMLL